MSLPPPPARYNSGRWDVADARPSWSTAGTARQGSTRTIVSTEVAATQPRAPGHERPLTAQRAAGHGRLSADSAPGADVRHRALQPAARRRLAPGSILPRVPATPNTLTVLALCRPEGTGSWPTPRHSTTPAGINSHTLTYSHYPRNPAPPPIKCILPPKFRPARGLAPPRVRASPYATTPAPRPRPPFPFPAREVARGSAPRHSRVPLLCALCVLCGKRAFPAHQPGPDVRRPPSRLRSTGEPSERGRAEVDA